MPSDFGYDGSVAISWNTPFQLHHSHIETLVGMCAKRYEFEYVNRVQRIPTSTEIRPRMGTAIHGFFEEILAGEKVGDAMEKNWKQTVEPLINTPEEYEKLSREYESNALAGRDWILDNIDIMQVNSEKKFILPKVNGLSPHLEGIDPRWSFAGSMDLVVLDDAKGIAHIYDIKTRERSNFARNMSSTQAPMYSMAAMYYGYEPRFTYVELIKGNINEQEIDLPEGKMNWFFIKTRQAIDYVEKNYFPINPSGWWCSSKYCNFWSICRGKYEPNEEEQRD